MHRSTRALAESKGKTGASVTREEIIELLSGYFEQKARLYGIDLAFLYGSWAHGQPRSDSDVDVAVMFQRELSDDEAFDVTTEMSVDLTMLSKLETNVLYIDRELSKPMLHYNAIVQGVPVYMSSFTRYADVRNYAMFQMEDFSIFGLKWQQEVVEKQLKRLSDG